MTATRVRLTDTQGDALRRYVGRDPQGQWRLGRGTDESDQRLDSRVGRALIEHGLIEWVAQPDGPVQLTDDGRAWVHDGGSRGLADEARAELDAASRADALDTPRFVVREQPDLGLWVIDTPDGWDPADGAFDSSDAAMAFVDQRMGRQLEWEVLPGGAVFAADPVEHDATDDQDEISDAEPAASDQEEGAATPAGEAEAAPSTTTDPHEEPADASPGKPAAIPVGDASPNPIQVPRTYNGREITRWKVSIKKPHVSVIHGILAQMPVDGEAIAVIRLRVDEESHWHVDEDFAGRGQELEIDDLWVLPDRYAAALVREAEKITGDDDTQPRLPLEEAPAGDAPELIDRLNRDEQEVRDDKGRRDWGDRYDDDPPAGPVDVSADRIADVAELLQTAGTKGHPARSMDLQALAVLVADGRARVEPEWWLADPGRETDDEDQAENAWAWSTELQPADPAAAVDELLAAGEEANPQYRVERAAPLMSGLWVVVPPGGMPATGTHATAADARAFVQASTGPLEWRRTDGGAWVADAPAEEVV